MKKEKTLENKSYWIIDISFPRGQGVRMSFTDKPMAQQQYEQIRALGIYQGLWIEKINLEEHLNAA